jgi:glyoxylate/hydroxypyruvate reductase A
MKTIVFISELESDLQEQWLAWVNKQLINATILLPEQVSESQARGIEIAIVANPNPKHLARYPNLVWIQSIWAGVEKLMDGILQKPIKLVRLVDPQLAQSMAESVLAWTLYLQRNMHEYAKQQVSKHWNQLPCIASKELRVSVLGAGELGLTALNALSKLEYQVSCWSRTPKQFKGIKSYTDLNGLQIMLSRTDILINLLPLTQQTHYLLDKKLLSTLPNGAKLINFSRGAVIDTKALLELLDIGHLSHAVLDVFENEPLTTSDPIWSNPNITVLPHISAPTNMHTASKIVANNINEYHENDVTPKSVDLSIGY